MLIWHVTSFLANFRQYFVVFVSQSLLSNRISRSLVSNAWLFYLLTGFHDDFWSSAEDFKRNVFTCCALSSSVSFLALFAASTLYLGRERVPMPCIVRAAKHHAGSWPRQSTVINLKNKRERGRQSELPLFTCTRRRSRLCCRGSAIVNGERGAGEGASQVCTTCVGNEAEKRAAEVSWKLISPGSG